MSDDLSTRDLRRALDVVWEMNETGRDRQASAVGLAKLGSLVGCDIVACVRAEQATRRMLDAVTDPPEQNLMGNPQFGVLAHQHPGFAAYRAGRLPRGSSAALTDLVGVRELRRIPLYADLYRPRGMVDELLCVIRADDRQGVALTFGRSRHGFSRRDRALVDLLAPHMAQALARLDGLTPTRREKAERAAVMRSMLTPRERQVTDHLSSGATDREIARSLAISPRTVHKHLQHIYRKLGMTNRAGLIALLSA